MSNKSSPDFGGLIRGIFAAKQAINDKMDNIFYAVRAIEEALLEADEDRGDGDTKPDLDLAERLVECAPSHFREYADKSIPLILVDCEKHLATLPQIAYILATAEHEAGLGRWPREIWGPTPAQERYENSRSLGNTQAGDGFRFRGRGLVHITGRANYQKWADRLGWPQIMDEPELLEDMNLAAEVLVVGMLGGMFTGKSLGDYVVGGDNYDFVNARRVVNGDVRRNGAKIAAIADGYLRVLEAS